MRKLILIIVLFFMSILSSLAQSSVQDVVYFKNGSLIRGNILEHVIGQTIKIETYDKSIFVFKSEDVDKIEKKEIKVSAPESRVKRKSLYFFTIEFGYCPGVGKIKVSSSNNYSVGNQDRILSIQTLQGVKLHPNFSIAIGVGADDFRGIDQIPVFLNLRPSFSNKATSGFVDFNIGYNIGIRKWEQGYFNNNNSLYYSEDITDKGGLMANPQIGIRSTLANGMAFYFSAGYKYIENKLESQQSYSVGTQKQSAGFLTFRFGVGLY